MTSREDAVPFEPSLGCLLEQPIAQLATQLGQIQGLAQSERDVIHAATRQSLLISLHRKLSRLLVLELNTARVEGRLKGETSADRWDDFLKISAAPEFWPSMAANYPTLDKAISNVSRNARAAAIAFAERWAEDRERLRLLLGKPAGALLKITQNAGDVHQGGHAVILVECEGGRIVYKPRPLDMEAALGRFVEQLRAEAGGEMPIRVPKVISRGAYGWAEFIAHVYAAGDGELSSFYRGVGQWLAIMRLMGGTDLHSENLIAHGPSPTIVDCETLFTPRLQTFVLGFGDATDRASRIVSGSVLASGLLPGRGKALGWRGIDMSGVGALPDQQPEVKLPDIIGAGTDEARIGTRAVKREAAQNLPAERPSLAQFWPHVLEGFDRVNEQLLALERRGELRGMLAPFEDGRLRVVLRATEVYAEIGRMLWHPVSLHDPAKSRAYAYELFSKMAQNVSAAPSAPDVIEGEIDALLAGDVPYFSTVARDGVLEGPGDTRWLEPRNLVEASYESWRGADFNSERQYVHAALVSAYVNDITTLIGNQLRPKTVRGDALDARRRRQAARIMKSFVDSAIHGGDGTATWIAPTYTTTGWSVQASTADIYSGISGAAILTGAYVREMRAGRADDVAGAEALLASLLRSLECFEEKTARNRRERANVRPAAPSGYLGIGSQIWAHLLLSSWGLDLLGGMARAAELARDVPAAARSDQAFDILAGAAGAIPPLLALAARSGDGEFLTIARALGEDLCQRAKWRDGQAYWTNSMSPEGMGGFAHGVTGVGWALRHLARVAPDARFDAAAKGAFAFEDSLFDEEERNWIDMRTLGGPKTASGWCHGSVGIALARLDLDPGFDDPDTRRALHDAAAATERLGIGWNHCLCHGDFGAWELLDAAIAHGEGPKGMTREGLLAQLVTSLEDNGPVCGMAKDAFVPGLLPGVGGIAYQLLRAHPESQLPSVLILRGESG